MIFIRPIPVPPPAQLLPPEREPAPWQVPRLPRHRGQVHLATVQRAYHQPRGAGESVIVRLILTRTRETHRSSRQQQANILLSFKMSEYEWFIVSYQYVPLLLIRFKLLSFHESPCLELASH